MRRQRRFELIQRRRRQRNDNDAALGLGKRRHFADDALPPRSVTYPHGVLAALRFALFPAEKSLEHRAGSVAFVAC